MTIDVEDYFQVSAFAPYISRTEWGKRESRVERNVDRILGMLSEADTKATFFTLGWIAERYPNVVRMIANEGHELASHGYGHERACDLTQSQFLLDVRKSKIILEDLIGEEVKGYRAPSFSINKTNLWAFDCLVRAGYRYSSSIYPILHDHYGMPLAPRFSHSPTVGLLEIPITTYRVMNRNFPASGGGYFWLLPYKLSRWLFSRINFDEQQAVVFYFHPWEIDPQQPRIDEASGRARFRHYLNLDRMESRLVRMLKDFNWGRMDEIFLEWECPGARAAGAVA